MKPEILQKGLSDAEVALSRNKNGENVLTPPPRDPWWVLFLEKFDDPIIRILIIAAFLAIIVGVVEGSYAEGVGIIVAIALATGLAFYNEFKAEKEFDVLNTKDDEKDIEVIRNRTFAKIPRKDLVVGDIVIINIGEEVPADGILLESTGLQVDESKLTGESKEILKSVVQGSSNSESIYPENLVLRGTTVKEGRGIIQIASVGNKTEIGKTAEKAIEETEGKSPLNIQLDRLSKFVGVVGFSVALLTFIALTVRGVFIGELTLSLGQWYFLIALTICSSAALVRVWLPTLYDLFELIGFDIEPPEWIENSTFAGWMKSILFSILLFGLFYAVGVFSNLVSVSPAEWLPPKVWQEFLQFFMVAVAIIVVAVPEGLPMSVTLSLAYSMRRMIKNNTLVKRLHACETIGAATVICSDKTGTLTANEMRVFSVEISGISTPPCFKKDSFYDTIVLESIAINTTADLGRTDGKVVCAIGQPMECAMLMWLDQNKIDYFDYRANFETEYNLAFSNERKYMATGGVSKSLNKKVLYVKGAPEIVLQKCINQIEENKITDLSSKQITEKLTDFQRRGMRTLGFAYREIDDTAGCLDINEICNKLTWIGFFAIADPIRADVPNAINLCKNAGIEVKMITGDISETALEIAVQSGIIKDKTQKNIHITGDAFSELSDDEARLIVKDIKVLSRAQAMHKLRMVTLLKESGEVVAFAGDGVNDAAALNHSNVGLAMGINGTDLAKEVSDIVLLDDSFPSITHAVMWGRSLYKNIQRFILYQFTVNVVALGIILIGPFIGIKFPLTVTQMLWVNLIMDTLAALALASEPANMDVMSDKPRRSDSFIVSPGIIKNVVFAGLSFLAILIFFLFQIQKDGEVTSYELTLFFTTFVMLQFWNLFNARSYGSKFSAFSGLLKNRGFFIVSLVIVFGQILMVSFGGEFFRTSPLSLKDWIMIISSTSIVLWLGEIMRFVKRRETKPILKGV